MPSFIIQFPACKKLQLLSVIMGALSWIFRTFSHAIFVHPVCFYGLSHKHVKMRCSLANFVARLRTNSRFINGTNSKRVLPARVFILNGQSYLMYISYFKQLGLVTNYFLSFHSRWRASTRKCTKYKRLKPRGYTSTYVRDLIISDIGYPRFLSRENESIQIYTYTRARATAWQTLALSPRRIRHWTPKRPLSLLLVASIWINERVQFNGFDRRD